MQNNILRYRLFLIVFFVFPIVSFASNELEITSFNPDTTILNNTKELPQRRMDKMPEYPGGETAMIEFISKHMKYPKKARANGVEGKVVVKFIIKKNGEVFAVKVLQSVSPEIDEEAIRIINKMPNWTPAEYNGKPSATFMSLPLNFLLEVK